jgi:hypothetical protein
MKAERDGLRRKLYLKKSDYISSLLLDYSNKTI